MMDELEKEIQKAKESYTQDDIQVLEGLEAVRKRPGMYIGSTSVRGLHHLVWEIVDNSIDEALAGYADTITVTIEKGDVIKVVDNGRGMPVEIHKKTCVSTVETIFTVLHAGGKFGGGAYKVSGGLHGVGASVVNALSTWLEVTVAKDGKLYQCQFKEGGKVAQKLHEIGTCDLGKNGSTVRFKADPTIFTDTTVYDYDTLKERLKQLAYLNKGIRIVLTDERGDTPKVDEFLYEGGIKQYVEFLNKGKQPVNETIFYCEGEEVGEETGYKVLIEVSLQYNDSYNSNVYTFCNNIHTVEGGYHEDGFKMALNRIINNYAKDNNLLKKDDEGLTGEDVREGLCAIISIKHPNPQYEGQTKTKLGNSEVRKMVSSIVGRELQRFLLEHPSEAKAIVEKASLASKARLAAKKARELTRRKNVLEISNLPGKLADCHSKDATISEIYIVEGDSAGGSAKLGRDSNYQAILPLRGKILNVEKARLNRIYENAEIGNMITAFGCGIGEEMDLSKLRYHKIVIMTDADVDGSHIRTLLLTFLYRYFKPVIEQGYVYCALPPLYKIWNSKDTMYAYSDEELEAFKPHFAGTKFDIQRYKGLGEMDPDQLWETTMDPQRRTLKRVTIDDAIEADQVLSMLMGDEVEPRKDFIVQNAHYVQNLDF